jgi:hypothetical protein
MRFIALHPGSIREAVPRFVAAKPANVYTSNV